MLIAFRLRPRANAYEVTGSNSIAIGASSKALGENSTAIGYEAIAYRQNQIAVGTVNSTYTTPGITSAASKAVQVGATQFVTTDATGNLASSVYGPQNIAANTANITTNATNLNTLGNTTASALGGGSTYSAASGVSAPQYVVNGATYNNVGSAIGAIQGGIALSNRFFAADGDPGSPGALALGVDSTSIGNESIAYGDQSAALGSGATARGYGSTAVGSGANTGNNTPNSTNYGTAVGFNALASGEQTSAFGYGASATGDNSTAIGAGAVATRSNQIAIGTDNSTYTAGGINSAASRAAQGGATQFITTDSNGNLANSAYGPQDIARLNYSVSNLQSQTNYLAASVMGHTQDISALKSSVQRGYEGTAVALATAGGNFLQENQKFSVTGKFGQFRGQTAFGGTAQARLSNNVIAHAGVGGGVRYGGVGAFGGLTIGW